jgi:type II secretory pathway pseudopilin PulG
LVELAVVLVIVTLLLGGLLVPLSAQVDLRNATDTQKLLADSREALVGFAASRQASDGKPYLPCPDTNNDGFEDRKPDKSCVSPEGGFPWTDLGLGREDAWGSRFRYRVASDFSSSEAGFALSTKGNLQVCTTADCSSGNKLAAEVPVVIVSHGKNGAGAVNQTGTINPLSTDADELENSDGDNSFVSHEATSGFDDLVTWLSPNLLVYRMIAVGRLP